MRNFRHVTDPSSRPRGGAAGPAFSAADVVRVDGGPAPSLERSPDPRRHRRLASGRPRTTVRGLAGRAHRRPRVPRPGNGRRGRGAHRQPATRRGDPRRARRRHRGRSSRTACGALGALACRPGAGGSTRSSSGSPGSIAKTSDQGGGRGRPRPALHDPPERGQPEQRDRPAADAPAAGPGARGRGARDGHVRRRRDRRPGRDRPRRRSGSSLPSSRSTCADRDARCGRAREGRARRGAADRRHGRPQRRRSAGRPDGRTDRGPDRQLWVRSGRRRGRGTSRVAGRGRDALHPPDRWHPTSGRHARPRSARRSTTRSPRPPSVWLPVARSTRSSTAWRWAGPHRTATGSSRRAT